MSSRMLSETIQINGEAKKIGSFNKTGLEYTLKGLNCFALGNRYLRYAGKEKEEDRDYEGWEITAHELIKCLTSDKRCRIIIDYDPAERHIGVYSQPITDTTQSDGIDKQEASTLSR